MRGPRSRRRRVSGEYCAESAALFYMPSQPKIRAAWYFVDRDVAQVCRDSDDLTVPTVSEVRTLADAHGAARGSISLDAVFTRFRYSCIQLV